MIDMSDSVVPPPPPGILNGIGLETEDGGKSHPRSSGLLIVLLILPIILIVCVSLFLLLRRRNRQSRSASVAASGAGSTSRVSPEESPASSLVDSLPMFQFSSIMRRTANTEAPSVISADCAVCLSKFEAQDQLRLLPLCFHAFHAECIDTWLNANQSCPLCRSPVFASEADLEALLAASSGGVNGSSENRDSLRIEIGSVSRRQISSESAELQVSYSIGSFDYIVDDLSEVRINQIHQIRSGSYKEEAGGGIEAISAPGGNLAAEISSNRSWIKECVDRLSISVSSRALSFRSSGSFFTGSSRRTDAPGVGDWDLEANRAGIEISEFFRWISGYDW